MTITGFANITNQITTGAPQAGFRHDPSAVVSSSDSTTEGSAPLLQLNLSDRQGHRSSYSVEDAATSLWKKDNLTFNLNDPDSIDRWVSSATARLQSGVSSMDPTEAELTAYIGQLRQTGLDSTVNWSGLGKEFAAFQATTPDELTAQRSKLDDVYQAGKTGMIDGYIQLLQDNLGISNSDAQAVKDSFSVILAEKVDAYRGALEKVSEAVSQTGPDSVWLQNHDAYIASQLRAAGTEEQSKSRYSVQDLTAAGQIAQSYQTEIFNAASCGRNEATLALNLSMADMKAETMIQKGLVSQNMVSLLRSSRAQGHENALNALDQALAARESTRSSGEPKGTFAPVDRSVFQGIYQAVMGAYQQNGGNGAEAIRAGVAYGQNLTAQATAQNPNILRWGVSIDDYWKNFYKAPDTGEVTALDRQVDKLLAQIGKTSSRGSSTYQKYTDDWRDFLTAIGGGSALNILA